MAEGMIEVVAAAQGGLGLWARDLPRAAAQALKESGRREQEGRMRVAVEPCAEPSSDCGDGLCATVVGTSLGQLADSRYYYSTIWRLLCRFENASAG